MAVLLVGVDHIIQHGGYMFPKKALVIARFQEHLRVQFRSRGVSLLAEEFNDFLLSMNHTDVSTVRSVALELNIEHRFCDPTPAQRAGLGIESDSDRERYWLERIRDALNGTLLFVCGDDHVDAFSQLLQETGAKTEVVSRGWGSDLIHL